MVIAVYMSLQVVCQRCGIHLGREEIRLLRTTGNNGHTDQNGTFCMGDVVVSSTLEYRDPSNKTWSRS